jgi:mRNA interferase MazF
MERCEIWLVRLSPTVDKEISKTRPAIIVSDNKIGVLPLKVIVPTTDWKEAFAARPWMVCLEPSIENGLTKLSGADTFQIRSVAESRLFKYLGRLDENIMNDISEALAIVLAI